jgi:hypothetical protein
MQKESCNYVDDEMREERTAYFPDSVVNDVEEPTIPPLVTARATRRAHISKKMVQQVQAQIPTVYEDETAFLNFNPLSFPGGR